VVDGHVVAAQCVFGGADAQKPSLLGQAKQATAAKATKKATKKASKAKKKGKAAQHHR
jgi:hypothetical protein